jgi:hypothetical protein
MKSGLNEQAGIIPRGNEFQFARNTYVFLTPRWKLLVRRACVRLLSPAENPCFGMGDLSLDKKKRAGYGPGPLHQKWNVGRSTDMNVARATLGLP